MTKQFLIEFEGAEDTTWVTTDEAVVSVLEGSAKFAANAGTVGPIPRVTVQQLRNCELVHIGTLMLLEQRAQSKR